MKEAIGYEPSKDPRLIDCKTQCGNLKCYARRYGLFAEKTCHNFVERKPMTNADRIRAMTDEELAEMMAHGNCGYCKIHDYCFSQKGVDCDEAWLDWLQQEVEDG